MKREDIRDNIKGLVIKLMLGIDNLKQKNQDKVMDIILDLGKVMAIKSNHGRKKEESIILGKLLLIAKEEGLDD